MSSARVTRWMAACASLAALAVAGLPAAADQRPAAELLVLADRAKDYYNEAVLHVKATVVPAKKRDEPAEFDVYRKGNDKTLVVFTSGKQKDRRMLTVGDKSWLIVPGSSRSIPMTPNQRLLGGASMADVARISFAEDFAGTLLPQEEPIGGLACDVVDLASKKTAAVYRSGTIWIDRREHLARKLLLKLGSGKPAKEVLFEKYGTEGTAPIILEMSIRDLAAGTRGLTTKLEYSQYRRMSLPDSLFTPEGARRIK